MTSQQITLTLRAVTPLFLNGADNQTPELRAPSFRGVLRFWLRALLGAQVGNDTTTLYTRESHAFGSTTTGSPVVVRVAAPSALIVSDRRVLPHSAQKAFANPSVSEGNRCALTLAARVGMPHIPNEALAALLMLVSFGGVGKRSRRGFGSLQPEAVSASDSLADLRALLGAAPADGAALAAHLGQVLARAQALCGGAGPGAKGLASYPILSAKDALVLVCKEPFPTRSHPYAQAMVDFWELLRSPAFRQHERQFGFAETRQRRASPLILHIAETPAGQHLVLTAFRSQLSDRDQGNWSVLQDFVRHCRSLWDGEYLLGKEDPR